MTTTEWIVKAGAGLSLVTQRFGGHAPLLLSKVTFLQNHTFSLSNNFGCLTVALGRCCWHKPMTGCAGGMSNGKQCCITTAHRLAKMQTNSHFDWRHWDW